MYGLGLIGAINQYRCVCNLLSKGREIIDNNGGSVGDKGNYAKEGCNAIQSAATFDVTAILNKEDITGGSRLEAALTDDGYSDFAGWQLNPIETILQQVRLLLYQAVIVSQVKLFERPNQMLHTTLASSPR